MKPFLNSKIRWLLILCVGCIPFPLYADPVISHPFDGHSITELLPSVAVYAAPKARVTTEDSTKILTLFQLHPLVGFKSARDQERHFRAFSSHQAPRAWNLCNQLKSKLHTWNRDQRNALFIFEEGPPNGINGAYQVGVLAERMANDPSHYSTAGKMGALPLLLENAVETPQGNSHRFVISAGNATDGIYKNVMIVAECYAAADEDSLFSNEEEKEEADD